MKQAYGYCRCSSVQNSGGHTFERQKDAIERFAGQNKYEVVHYYNETISGTTTDTERPIFMDMIQTVLGNGVNTIVVERLDRLSRDVVAGRNILIYLASKDINLIDASTGQNITEAIHADPMQKALVAIQQVFSELEKNMLVMKLRKSREAKRAKNGKCEGRKSYSEIHPDIVEQIKRLRRKPRNANMKRRTHIQCACELNRLGYKTMTGKSFSGQIVQNILNNL